jgi:hypothetical protein
MTPKKLILGEVVSLKWIDSRAKAGWQKSVDAVPVGIVYSIGFVVAATDEYLTITTSLHADNAFAYDPISIPWVSIKALSV